MINNRTRYKKEKDPRQIQQEKRKHPFVQKLSSTTNLDSREIGDINKQKQCDLLQFLEIRENERTNYETRQPKIIS